MMSEVEKSTHQTIKFEYYINSSFTQKLREELPDHCTSYSAAASPASTLLPPHDELGPGLTLNFKLHA